MSKKPIAVQPVPGSVTLTKVRDYFKAHPESWTQKCFGRNSEGVYCFPHDPDIVSFCVSSLISHLLPTPGNYEYNRTVLLPSRAAAESALVTAIGDSVIPEWNDMPGRNVYEVIAACDRAIEIAKQREVEKSGS